MKKYLVTAGVLMSLWAVATLQAQPRETAPQTQIVADNGNGEKVGLCSWPWCEWTATS